MIFSSRLTSPLLLLNKPPRLERNPKPRLAVFGKGLARGRADQRLNCGSQSLLASNISSTMSRISRSEQTAGGQRVVADGLIDHLAVARQASGHGQLLDLGGGSAQQRQLRRHLAHRGSAPARGGWPAPATSTQQPSGRLSIRPKLRTLRVELEHLAVAEDGVEDVGGVLLSAREIERLGEPLVDFVAPGGLAVAVFLEDVAYSPGFQPVPGRQYFSIRSGRLRNHALYSLLWPEDSGDVVAQRQEHLVADDLLLVDVLAPR